MDEEDRILGMALASEEAPLLPPSRRMTTGTKAENSNPKESSHTDDEVGPSFVYSPADENEEENATKGLHSETMDEVEKEHSMFGIQDKKEAKKTLSREEYKQWKKSMKKRSQTADDEEKKRKKKEREGHEEGEGDGRSEMDEDSCDDQRNASQPFRDEFSLEERRRKEKGSRKRSRHHEDDHEDEDRKREHRRRRRHHRHHRDTEEMDEEEGSRSNISGEEHVSSRKTRREEHKTKRERKLARRKRKNSNRTRKSDGEEEDGLRMDSQEMTMADMLGGREMEVEGEAGVGQGRNDKAAPSVSSTPREALRSTRKGGNISKPARPQPPTGEQLKGLAMALLQKMEKAQQEDDKCLTNSALYGPPLHRIALSAEVAAMFAKKAFQPFLLEEGKGLQLLSRWLLEQPSQNEKEEGNEEEKKRFSGATPRLGSLELRSSALDILLRIPLYESAAEDEAALEGKQRAGAVVRPTPGYTRENLIATDLGRAVNLLRQHAHETEGNRAKCAALLERFSKAFTAHLQTSSFRRGGGGRSKRGGGFHGRGRAGGGGRGAGAVDWRCSDRPDVASPFQMVPTVCEQFQKEFMRPDPRDPTSYFNLLPPRLPVKVVTNVSGSLAQEFAEKFSSEK